MYAGCAGQQEQEREQELEQDLHVLDIHTASMGRQARGESEQRPMDQRVVGCLGISVFTKLPSLVDDAIDLSEGR